jgi:cell division protein FtsW
LVIQAVANMAVNVNIVPVTGVTLPLVSMGGSSFLFTCAAIGIILSVARNVEQLEGNTSTGINNIESNNTIQKVVNPAIA